MFEMAGPVIVNQLPAASQDDTRDRLLASAGEEFARSGFRDASVRTICEAAGANVSAVKYYFGSKGDLYKAVWEMAASQMFHGEPMPRLGDGTEARATLRDFMAWFMRLVLSQNKACPWVGRLLAHETVVPTEHALDTFVARCAGPIRAELRGIVASIVGPTLPERDVDDLTNGVIALCVNQQHSCQILTRLGFPPPEDVPSINRMAGLLAGFALSGLDGVSGPPDGEG